MSLPEKFGEWDVAADGGLSYHGQSMFVVYSAEGKITTKFLKYRLLEVAPDGTGKITAEEVLHA